jgi:hypothetical protein
MHHWYIYIDILLIICDAIIIILKYVFFFFCFIYKNGWTPLMWSVKNGNLEICKLLIDNGALPSINTPDNNVNTTI